MTHPLHFHEHAAGEGTHPIGVAFRRRARAALRRHLHDIRGPLERLATRLPTLPLLRFDLVKCPLPSASVDAVVILDVREHIEDHAAALAQVVRTLRPGGTAVIAVNAG